MLKVKYFSDSLEQCISSLDDSIDKIVVAPGPEDADYIREVINDSSVSVITVSALLKEYIKKGEIDTFRPVRKVELMQLMALAYRKSCDEVQTDLFFQAFTLITELRSFTLDLLYLEDFLEELGDRLSSAVRLLWNFIEVMTLADEHRQTALVADAFRTPDHKVFRELYKKNYIFYGFAHLSGIQIDFFKSISAFHDVTILYPDELSHGALITDWISWLEVSNDKDILEIVEERFASLVTFPKGRIAETLSKYKEDYEIIGIASNELTWNDLQAISVREVESKISTDFFLSPLKELNEKLTPIVAKGMTFAELKVFIEEYIQESIANKNPRQLKICLLFQDLVLEHIEYLGDELESVKMFDLYVLIESLRLNIPRVSAISSPQSEDFKKIYPVKSFDRIKGKKAILVISSFLSSIWSKESSYSSSMNEVLASLGPLKTSDYDYRRNSFMLNQFLKNNDVTIFLEEGILDSTKEWAQYFEGVEFNKIRLSRDERLHEYSFSLVRNVEDNLKVPSPITVSAFQTYLECPRKYYLNFLDKLQVRPKLPEMSPAILGDIEHKIIEEVLIAFGLNSTPGQRLELAMSVFNKKCLENDLNLTEVEKFKYLQEVKEASGLGLSWIESFAKDNGFDSVDPEQPFENEYFRGRVDLVISGPSGKVIVDFKRSGSSIPSKKDLETFKKIQVWAYANHFSREELLAVAYVNLSELKESMIISTKGSLSFDTTPGKSYELLDNQLLDSFSEFLKEKKQEMKDDHLFSANPTSKDACTYCTASLFCDRRLK